MLPAAFRPPDHATTGPGDPNPWLAWLDANRLTPAAARALAETPLPDDVRQHLNAGLAQSRAQWLLSRAALQDFLTLMAQDPALPVILLKGAALALSLYAEPAIRPMNDVDLLVAPDALPEALQRVRKAGYVESSLGAGDDAGYLHHFIFNHPATGVRFELHRTLPLLPDDAALDWFLARTEAHSLAELPFSTLTPTAQILHLAAHAVLEHGGAQGAVAIWFYDIDQLIRRRGDDIVWEQTLARAQTLRWEAALQEALRLARRNFDTPIPAAIKDWMAIAPEELSGYQLMQQMSSQQRSSSLLILHILQGLTWRQRISQSAHMLFPAPAYMRRRYPGVFLPLTYPYRWFDAARKLLPALLRLSGAAPHD